MANTKKQESFLPLFVGDFSAATAEWEGEEKSLYLTLLMHEWALGSLPNDTTKLCRLVLWDRKLFDRMWPQVSIKFICGLDGRLVNPRLEQHRTKVKELSKKNSASGRKGAASRYGERYSERQEIASGENVASAITQLRRTP